MIIPELSKITAEEMRKIFPQQYYQKYATHLKVVEFQHRTIEEEKKRTHIHFQLRKPKVQIPEVPQKKVKITRYDNFEQTIEKNKEEVKRLGKYTALLDMKLKTSPSPKKDVIRSPSKLQRELEDQVLLRLKAIDDMEYEEEMKHRQQFREKQEKQSYCKFIHKSKSTGVSPRKLQNPESPQFHLVDKLQNIADEALQKNSSLLFSKRSNSRNSASYIININSAIRKSHQTIKKSGTSMKNQSKVARALSNRKLNSSKLYSRGKKKEKKDLIAETQKIRYEVGSMKLIKRYDELMKMRAHNEQLSLNQ